MTVGGCRLKVGELEGFPRHLGSPGLSTGGWCCSPQPQPPLGISAVMEAAVALGRGGSLSPSTLLGSGSLSYRTPFPFSFG